MKRLGANLDLAVRRWRADAMSFRREAILMEDGTPFGDQMEPFQTEDFAALDSGQYQHAYLERPRGHAKTFDIGTEAVKELLLGRAGQRLYCAAADEEQARLIFDDVKEKFQRSLVLRNSIVPRSKEIVVRATGSTLRVLASDAPSAYGLRPDWIAIDELAEWRKRELWDSLWSATGKRPNCRMLVISSAGWDRTSIAWEVRQHAEQESDWYFKSRGQCASWISSKWLEQQRRTLPAHVFARLHSNIWVEGAGAFLTFSEVDRIFSQEAFESTGPAAIGLDLGLSKDRTVAALLRLQGELVVVQELRTWEGSDARKVDLQEVQAEVNEMAQHHSAPVIFDPWQGVYFGQRLQAQGVTAVEYTFSGEGRRRLFSVMLDLVRNDRLRSRPHEEFKRELLSLEITDRAGGARVDHRPGRHDDHVVAVALAAQHLSSRASGPPRIDWIDVPGPRRSAGSQTLDGFRRALGGS